MNIVWLPRALSDREAQIDYIAQDSPQAALDQGDRIVREIALLGDYPELGRVGREAGTRELVVRRSPFIIIYRINGPADRIEILRVLHGAMQWPPLSDGP